MATKKDSKGSIWVAGKKLGEFTDFKVTKQPVDQLKVYELSVAPPEFKASSESYSVTIPIKSVEVNGPLLQTTFEYELADGGYHFYQKNLDGTKSIVYSSIKIAFAIDFTTGVVHKHGPAPTIRGWIDQNLLETAQADTKSIENFGHVPKFVPTYKLCCLEPGKGFPIDEINNLVNITGYFNVLREKLVITKYDPGNLPDGVQISNIEFKPVTLEEE